MDEDKVKIYQRALAREKAARKQAEQILEQKSKELYDKSEQLRVSNFKLAHLYKRTSSELQGVFENIVDPYVLMDLQGNVLKMNQAAESLLGYALADKVNLTKLVDPNWHNEVAEGFKTLMQESSLTNFQVRIKTASGTSKLVHINASVVYDNDQKPVAAQGIVRDVTKERAAQQQLVESQSRLSTIIFNMESGILLEDENRDVIITNKRFCEFFNIPATPDQMIGMNCSNAAESSKHLFVNPQGFVERINKLVQEKKQVLSEELEMTDGRIFERDFIPIYQEETYQGHLWNYRDITLRRNFRESIEAEREKYSSIIANMNLGLIEVDTEDRILMVNQSLEKMSGYSQKELIGKKGTEILLHQEDLTRFQKENTKRLQGASNSYEVRARRKDGSIRYWLISGAPQYNLHGKMTGSVGIHLDITALKNLELQKENLLKKLEKSNNELQEYAHVVSHDLKSPLRSINALVSWLREDNAGAWTAESKGHLDMIDVTLEKMETLISDVLEYSSVGADNSLQEEVDLNEVIQDILTLLHIPEHIDFQVLNPLPVICADRVKIQQLFQNLISNAERYCDKDLGYIKVDYTEEEEHHKFSISDNGIGIPKEFHQKIFKIFQSLNKRKDSTGIGLSIVKKIVDLYGGTIWVESTPGQGASFHFTILKHENRTTS